MSSDVSAELYSNGVSQFADVKGLSRDRPWLLPTNRKLRHLQGISLRNLTLTKPRTRSRGKTIDDESLPTTLRSPAKILAQRENRKLEHSKSSSDLKSPSKSIGGHDGHDAAVDDVPDAPPARPQIGNSRRRSTLNWSDATSMVRQKKLEDVTENRMADTWFSLHCPGSHQDPIYISEIVEKSMNPSFRYFDLNVWGPTVSRQDEMTLKFWAKNGTMEKTLLLTELQLHLSSLQFIGKTLETFHHPLPKNCIVFHLSDGIYTSFTDLPLDEPVSRISAKPSKSASQSVQPTSSFDSLMRLSNLDDCIQDALATRSKLTSQIDALILQNKPANDTEASLSATKDSTASVNRAIATTRRSLEVAKKRRSDLQRSLTARRHSIDAGRLAQERVGNYLFSASDSIESKYETHSQTTHDLQGQVRRIAEDLSAIYPIDPIPDKPLAFTIRDLYLPNANFFSNSNSATEETTAAALGLVSCVIHSLSMYLFAPLPYPVRPNGSTSTIIDPITTSLSSHAQPTSVNLALHAQSQAADEERPSRNTTSKPPTLDPARIFPLYQTRTLSYRFEYAVFLLNTDLELLMSKQGLRMVDIRHTLANLKYLLFVLCAGTGAVPGRKAGGVRGLAEGDDDTVGLNKGKGTGEAGAPEDEKEDDQEGAFEGLLFEGVRKDKDNDRERIKGKGNGKGKGKGKVGNGTLRVFGGSRR